ncbi:hypothetical protein A0257_22120 [Hymenobacter psoromatis]|nr:hypothetical protein A0257_22120 [Hymenobacter psoromatis]
METATKTLTTTQTFPVEGMLAGAASIVCSAPWTAWRASAPPQLTCGQLQPRQVRPSDSRFTTLQKVVDDAGYALRQPGSAPVDSAKKSGGGYTIIYIKNKMNGEMSVYWHGVLAPSFYNGVSFDFKVLAA